MVRNWVLKYSFKDRFDEYWANTWRILNDVSVMISFYLVIKQKKVMAPKCHYLLDTVGILGALLVRYLAKDAEYMRL